MHWHAYTYTGGQWPKDSEARNVQAAVPPNTISQWFRKPQSMRANTFTDAGEVVAWLDKEVRAAPPADVEGKLSYLRDCVDRGADAYAGYYSRGQIVVRCALACPRDGERCPDPPR
ncbi:hypothetical protein [Streptomyces qinglanensis]|uniref:Uncharacterized protein n=1 Tax=Streptomyces qinglanensis TaxID=943816 RepID=A0A1H9U121_9ACTN|nr:hypothetical protein [Streptomyces qinglanensis]SES02968.1 hypothetical protein SAMN05421870_107189 [Streptomyces qinglanensis]